MLRVAIVDYGMGNLDSVARATEECGGRPVVTSSGEEIGNSPAVILPGVGAFAKGIERIRERGLDEILDAQVRQRGVPLLGLCLGMHLLATLGEEGGRTNGLGWIEGEVRRLPSGNGVRVPHVGWNEVHHDGDSRLLAGIESGRDFYFVHSYHFACADASQVEATTMYGSTFASVVASDNVFGVQFHPEKSQRAGFQLLRNFIALAERTSP
jgi:imidazole glycerol-phosphate synthase subunit HisH